MFTFCFHLVSDICAQNVDNNNNTGNSLCQNNGTCVDALTDVTVRMDLMDVIVKTTLMNVEAVLVKMVQHAMTR